MKAKFLKKEFILVILSLLFSSILIGCSINTSTTDSYNKKNSSISQDEKKEISKDSSKEVNPTEKLGKDENYKNNISPEKVIFLTNTAVFIGDATKAAFYGKNHTLNFTFPNNHGAYPVVTDMNISGFEALEGKTYVNNGIPGHEFG